MFYFSIVHRQRHNTVRRELSGVLKFFFSVRHCCPQHRLSALLFFFCFSFVLIVIASSRAEFSSRFNESDSELVLCKKVIKVERISSDKFSKSRRRSMIACEWISDHKQIIFWGEETKWKEEKRVKKEARKGWTSEVKSEWDPILSGLIKLNNSGEFLCSAESSKCSRFSRVFTARSAIGSTQLNQISNSIFTDRASDLRPNCSWLVSIELFHFHCYFDWYLTRYRNHFPLAAKGREFWVFTVHLWKPNKSGGREMKNEREEIWWDRLATD